VHDQRLWSEKRKNRYKPLKKETGQTEGGSRKVEGKPLMDQEAWNDEAVDRTQGAKLVAQESRLRKNRFL